MKITTFAALALAASLLAPMAQAEERFPAGGISLDPAAKVSIAKEDVYLSIRQVKVHYEYQSEVAQTVPMRFESPIVPIDGSPDHLGGVLLEEGEPTANYAQLQVQVAGETISPAIREHAFLNGQDITAELQAYGLPLYLADVTALQAAYDGLAAAQKAQVVDLGYVVLDDSGAPSVPGWQYQSVFEWEQAMVPGITEVDIKYVPMNGYPDDVHQAYFGEASAEDAAYQAELSAFYCLDEALFRAVKKKRDAGAWPEIAELGFETTQADRARPIGEFSLTVDKADSEMGEPMTFVAFCPSEANKVSDTAFRWKAKDFTPTRDFDVVYYAHYEAN